MTKFLGEVLPLLLLFAAVGLARVSCAKTLPASASCPSGGGNHAAADPVRGRHRRLQLPAGSQGRHAAGARDREVDPPRARRRDAAHDRRFAGPCVDQFDAQRRLRQLSSHRARLSRSVRQGRGGAGRRPAGPAIVLVRHTGHRQPAAAKQPRHRREGVCDPAADLLKPVHRRREEATDRHRRGAGDARGRSRSTSSPSVLRSKFSRTSSKSSGRTRTGPSRSSMAKAPTSPACPTRRKPSANAPRRRCLRKCSAGRRRRLPRCHSKACL